MPKWNVGNIPSQKGKRAIVTGVGGLGLEAALALTRAGAEVILAGRDERKGASSIRRVNANCLNANIRFEMLDLANLQSIENFAERIAAAGKPVDMLINNAGVMAPPTRKETADGFELQLGTNHLGHFALTGRLLPMLRGDKPARVVNVSSLAARSGKIEFDNLQSQNTYVPFRAYCQSKLANLLFAAELQRRSDQNGWNIVSSAAHPGISKTDLVANGPGAKGASEFITNLLGQSAADGALPLLYAATSEAAAGGGYFGPKGFMEAKGPPAIAKIPPAALSIENAERLWEESEKLTRVKFGGA